MQKLIQKLWLFFLFSLPFSLHFLGYEKASYRFGNFNPWVTGIVYLPEILLIIVFILFLINQLSANRSPLTARNKIIISLIFFFILNAGIVTYLQGDMVLFGFFTLRILEAGMVYMLFKNEIVPKNLSIKWLLYGAVFQILIAFLQTRLDHSLGLSFLGEPHLSPDTANVAKIDLAEGVKGIRGYGTFLHPNILGTYLMTILFISLPYLKKAALPFWVVILSGGIFLTGSLAAQLTTVVIFLFLGILAFFDNPIQKRRSTLALLAMVLAANAWLFFNSSQIPLKTPAITERLAQNEISQNMFLQNPWGVGVGNFTLKMENFSSSKLMPWEFQPVHNVYFLTLSEMGIQGLMILVLLLLIVLHKFWKKEVHYDLQSKTKILPLLALLIIASFDHLLLTSYVGPLLVGLALSEMAQSE